MCNIVTYENGLVPDLKVPMNETEGAIMSPSGSITNIS